MDENIFNVENVLSTFCEAVSCVPVRLEHKRSIKELYTQYGRFYHGIYHIAQMYHLHNIINKIQGNKCFPYDKHLLIVSAIVYHDAIYDNKATDNEYKSAELWIAHRKNSDSYLNADYQTKVVNDAILATANHFENREYDFSNPEDNIREWLLGLDLASLALPWDKFKVNNLLIRCEYAHLSDNEWKNGRGKFIKNLQTHIDNGGVIYRHPIMQELFEESARKNIERLLNDQT